MDGSIHHRLIATLVCCVALTAVAAMAPAAASAAIKLGVYSAQQGQVGAPEDAGELDRYAAMVGRKPDIVMDYSNITDPLLTPIEVSNLAARGQTPLVSWQLFQSGWGGPTIPLGDIAAGQYDSHLRAAANAARELPFSEILIRFAHEMNGTWYGWSGNPSAYVNAWRHMVGVFRQQGASNVKFIWSPNVDYGDYPFAGYFPGDAWVDYVALDGYNWGTTGQGPGHWQSLHSVFKSSYDQITQLSSKPVMIAEVSSSEVGGSKAAWIREGFLRTIPNELPRVEAVIWFNRDQEDDWRINSSTASLDAYRDIVSSSLYGGDVAAPAPAAGCTCSSATPSSTVTGSVPYSASAPGSVPYSANASRRRQTGKRAGAACRRAARRRHRRRCSRRACRRKHVDRPRRVCARGKRTSGPHRRLRSAGGPAAGRRQLLQAVGLHALRAGRARSGLEPRGGAADHLGAAQLHRP